MSFILLHVSAISCRLQGFQVRRNVYNSLVEKKMISSLQENGNWHVRGIASSWAAGKKPFVV